MNATTRKIPAAPPANVTPAAARPIKRIDRLFGALASALTAVALSLTPGAGAGCDSTFKPASYIERPRVVGAVVSVAAEPGRAWVMPGEMTTVSWLTVSRQQDTSLEWAFVLCVGENGACAGAPLATLTGQGATAAVTFAAPDAAALGEKGAPFLMGAICGNGTLTFDPASMMPVCAGEGASVTNAVFAVPVQRGADTNHHPVLADNRLQLGGVDWISLPAGDAGAPCDAGGGLPTVMAGSGKQKFRFVSDANDREHYLAGQPAVATLEELQISQFTTAGKLTFSYSAIPATDTRADADATIEWEAPRADEVPAGGMTVQFHFVGRDLRGGIDAVHRALCVIP
ncbi:MAG: hypothetical protein ABUL67_01710 [Haliangium ochraceum]